MAAPNRRPNPLLPTDSQSSTQTDTDDRGRFIPTAETQDLYNIWREARDQVEQQSNFADGLQLRNRQTSLGPPGLLRPRSPSAASTWTSAESITRGVNDVGINDRAVSENGTGARKAQRHGPLPRVKKAKAALVRKLGSCPICQRRKVKCDHHDLSLFEAAYEARSLPRQIPLQPRLTVPPFGGYLTPQQLSPTTVPGTGTDLLRGIGQDIGRFPGPIAGSPDDPDDPLLQSPLGGISPSRARPLQTSPFNPFNTASPIANPSYIDYLVDTSPPPQQPMQEKLVPIGRELSGILFGWECQGERSYSTGASLSSGSTEICLERCRTLEELQAHFMFSHAPYRDANPAYLYKCLVCSGMTDNIQEPCLHCGDGGFQFESWFYGYVGGSSSSSLPYTSLYISPEKPAYNPYLGQQGFSGGYNQHGTGGSSYYQFNGHGNGNGNGCGSGSGSAGNGPWIFNCSSKKDDYGTASCGDPVAGMHKLVFHVHDPLPAPCSMFQARRGLLHMQFAGLPVSGVAICMLPFLLACVLLYTAVLAGCPTSDCVGVAVGRTASKILKTIRAHMSASSIICILVGLTMMWLFKHIRFRLSHGQSSSFSGQYCMRELLGVSIDHGRENVSGGDASIEMCLQTQRMMTL